MGSVRHGKKREGKVKESENWRRALVYSSAPEEFPYSCSHQPPLLVALLASTVAPRSSLLENLCDHRPQVHYPQTDEQHRSRVMIMSSRTTVLSIRRWTHGPWTSWTSTPEMHTVSPYRFLHFHCMLVISHNKVPIIK